MPSEPQGGRAAGTPGLPYEITEPWMSRSSCSSRRTLGMGRGEPSASRSLVKVPGLTRCRRRGPMLPLKRKDL